MKKVSTRKQKNHQEIFVFTKENLKKAQYHIAKYPEGRQASAVLPLLDLAQRQSGGWLPHQAIETVADLLKMPILRVFEVASFYTMFNLKQVGKYHLQVCGTTPCWLRGAAELKERCEKVLGIKDGEVTCDGKFSLIEVECLGACVNAPVVQINDDYYEDLTPDQLEKLLNNLGEDIPCLPGPQIARHNSAPMGYSFSGAHIKPIKRKEAGGEEANSKDLKVKEDSPLKGKTKKTVAKSQSKEDANAG